LRFHVDRQLHLVDELHGPVTLEGGGRLIDNQHAGHLGLFSLCGKLAHSVTVKGSEKVAEKQEKKDA